MLKIFVSSVMEGLKRERNAAEKAIKELDLDPEQFELFPAYPGTTKDICLERVKECNIFILILKDRISPIVLEEFQTAEEYDKDILVFLKSDPNNEKLKDFIEGIERDYTYKKFSTENELKRYIKKSIQNVLVGSYKSSRDEYFDEKNVETLIDETITVDAFQRKWFVLELEEGDTIRGLVREADGDDFNVYFLSEKALSDYLNGKEFKYHGDEEITSHTFDLGIENDGTYYLVFDTNALIFLRKIHIKIRKISYY